MSSTRPEIELRTRTGRAFDVYVDVVAQYEAYDTETLRKWANASGDGSSLESRAIAAHVLKNRAVR